MSQSPWSQRGCILFEQRRYATAESFFRQALSDDPTDSHSFYLLALCQLNQSAIRPARASIDQALALDPGRSSFHALRALILSYLGLATDAIASSEEAISLDPECDYVFALRADMFVILSRWFEAELAARRALEINPHNTEAANQLILALRKQNFLSESAEQVRILLAFEPDRARNQETAAWVALERGKLREAETHFLEALRLDPNRELASAGLKRTLKQKFSPYRMHRAHPRLVRISIYLILSLLSISTLFYSRGLLAGLFLLSCIAGIWAAIFGLKLGPHLTNLLLWFNPSARHLLAPWEKWGILVVGGMSVLSVASLIACIQIGSHILIGTCLLLHGSTFCFGQAFSERETRDGFLVYIVMGISVLVLTLYALSIGIPAEFN